MFFFRGLNLKTDQMKDEVKLYVCDRPALIIKAVSSFEELKFFSPYLSEATFA